MAEFDQNQWYQINNQDYKLSQSLVGTAVYEGADNRERGAVFMRKTNSKDVEQQWQIFPSDDSTFYLRTKKGGDKTYLGARLTVSEVTQGNTRLATINTDYTSGPEVTWKLVPADNGQFYMENVANGSSWRASSQGEGRVVMTSDFQARPDKQRWTFTKMGPIDDETFSALNVEAIFATMRDSATVSSGSISAPTSTRTTSTRDLALTESQSQTETGEFIQTDSLLVATTGVSAETWKGILTATATQTSAATPTVAVNPPAVTQNSNSGLPIAAAIGIGVAGALLGLAGIIFGIVILLRRKKSRDQGDEVPLNEVKVVDIKHHEQVRHELSGVGLQELSADNHPVELPSSPIKKKLPELRAEKRSHVR